MKKLLLLASILVICSCKKEKDESNTNTNPDTGSSTNCSYTFEKSSDSYASLSSTDGYYDGYDGSGTSGAISIPFSFSMFNKAVTTFEVDNVDMYFLSGTESIYLTCDMPSNNPAFISWKTTGTSGNRIMKIQLDDSRANASHLNVQIWLYEQSNKLEIHYGDNTKRLNNMLLPLLIRYEGPTFLKGIALAGDYDNNYNCYIGDVSTPTSFCLDNSSNPDSYLLKGAISSGLVYRFTPKN